MMRNNHRRRAAAAVEFALCLVLGLLPMILAIMEWSWYFFQQTAVQQAVVDAGRVAAQVDMSSACPESTFLAEFEERMDTLNIPYSSGDMDAYVEWGAYGFTSEQIGQLRVTYSSTYQPILGLIPTPNMLNANFIVPMEDQTNAGNCAI